MNQLILLFKYNHSYITREKLEAAMKIYGMSGADTIKEILSEVDSYNVCCSLQMQFILSIVDLNLD